jgi:GT2 family glycosyltransferase
LKLSVVILNYNVRYFLELCLKSVFEAIRNIEAEVIVVDNASKDDSCLMIKELFPEIVLIENKENLGFSKGNNIGVTQAKGEYICILNPDTVVPEDIFDKLIAFSKTKEKLGIVGCKLINGSGAFLPESKRNIPYVKAAVKKLLGNPEDYYAEEINENETGEVDVLVGAFMLLKRDVYNKIGGFDEDYFMYGEDIDISYKALKAGYSNYYFGETKIIHFKGESTLRDKNYAKRFYGAMQIFYKKHFTKNILFDFFVWIGIKLVSVFPKQVNHEIKNVNRYVYISQDEAPKLKAVLKANVVLKQDLLDIVNIENGTELIFDSNSLSFKEIIEFMYSNHSVKGQLITYKIRPKGSDFILGSDNSICRGEVIVF